MENSIAAVETVARMDNGWTVIGLVKLPYRSGRRPCGEVAFARDKAPFEGLRCGTASYYIDETGGVIFYTGHYDLTREDALVDLTERAGITNGTMVR